MVLFYYTQLGEFKIIDEPQPGQEDYGIKYSEDETVIMSSTINRLVLEYVQNNYITYPVGFYKRVTLNDKKQTKMGEITSEVTGLSLTELNETVEKYLGKVTVYSEPISVNPSVSITYERFLQLMKQADKLLGGGSNYSKMFMESNAQVPKTYEDALKEYNEILDKDHFTGAYARLFCDYMGIVLAILPVFIAVTRGLRDRRARASEVIYSRRASSVTVITTRYLAMLVMLILPVILITGYLTIQCITYGNSIGINTDSMAFIKYIFGWLLPTIMVSVSVGVFFTELTETALAILIQGIWWIISIFTGISQMFGGYGWNLVPRHNVLGNYSLFHDNYYQLFLNRITYASIAVLLIIAAIIVYELKRKGKLIVHGKILLHRKSKSKI
jgi:hypothetical protein